MKVFTEILEIRQFSRQIKSATGKVHWICRNHGGAACKGTSATDERIRKLKTTFPSAASLYQSQRSSTTLMISKEYPRDLDSDLCNSAKRSGCDAVFLPSADIMYPSETYQPSYRSDIWKRSWKANSGPVTLEV
jgi:hypothetical protein